MSTPKKAKNGKKKKESKPLDCPSYNTLKHSHKLFIDHYLKHGNATKAYQEVYKTGKTAEASASRLLRNEQVKKALEERKAQLYSDLNITEEDLKRVWKEILNDPDAKTADRLTCTQIVGKYLGLFKESPQIAIFQAITKDDRLLLEDMKADAIEVEVGGQGEW